MPIRFIDKAQASRIGTIVSTLADASGALAGTHTAPPARTGTVGSMLQPITAALTGNFQSNANRTGTIATTLSGVTSAIAGTFTQAAGSTNRSIIFPGNVSGGLGRVEILADSASIPVNSVLTGDWTLSWRMRPQSGNNTGSIAQGANVNWVSSNILWDRDRFNQNRSWGAGLAALRFCFGLWDSNGDMFTWVASAPMVVGTTYWCVLQRTRSTGAVQYWQNGTRLINATSGPNGDISCPSTGNSGKDGYWVWCAEKHDIAADCATYLGEVHLLSGLIFSNAATITDPGTLGATRAETRGLYLLREETGSTEIVDENDNESPGVLMSGSTRSTVDLAPVSHGSAVSLEAAGFTLPSVRNSLRSTIEATGSGSNISLPSPYYVPDIATDDFSGYDDSTRGRAIRCMYTANNVFDLCFAWDRGSNAVANEVLRVDWWIRFQTLGGAFPAQANDSGGTASAGDDWQHKLFRYRFDRDSVLDAGASGDIYSAHWDNSDGSFFCGEFSPWHWVNGASSSSAPQLPPFVNNSSGRRAGGDDFPVAYGQLWAKCELVFYMGTGGADGRAFLYVRKEGEERRLVGSITGMNWFASGRAWRYFYWQNYLGNASPDTAFNGTWIAMDDVRVQRHSSSVACNRVILMSHSTLAASYAAGGWHEDQDVTDVSGDTVTIGSLNTGAGRTGICYLAAVSTDTTTRNDTLIGSVRQITVV